MFLIEFEGYDLTKYNDFLIECSQKNYFDQQTHRHHIIPKFMEGTNDKRNIIRLNQQDHFTAHLILAFCFPNSVHYYHGNIFSASRLQKGIDVPEGFQSIFSESQRMTVFGRRHSEFTKKKISESKKGKSPERWIIEAANASRRGVPLTQEHKDAISKHIKEQFATGKRIVNFGNPNSPGKIAYKQKMIKRLKTEQNGKDNPFAKKIEHVESGQIFDCLKDAMIAFGFTNYNILNRRIEKGVFRLLEDRPPTHDNLKYGNKAKKYLCVESGQIFKSKKDAIDELPFSSYMFDKLCKEGKFKVLDN